MCYIVRRTAHKPALHDGCVDPAWQRAQTLHVDHFHRQSSAHRPQTTARVLYDDDALFVLFQVHDRYVRSVVTAYQGPVSQDSCVECFLQPKPASGYFNFEFNCGGTMLLGYVDPAKPGNEWRIEGKWGQTVSIAHSMPPVVDPEITDAVTWHLGFIAPLDLLEHFAGPLRPLAASTWRANFFKCAKTSHPHWASWSPIGKELSFHQVEYFAPIVFGP